MCSESGDANTQIMTGPRRTRAAALRSGFDYQDLVAAESMLRILKHPSRYEWVKLEVKEAGKLDDVLVLGRDGVVEATQVKQSNHPLRPENAWTWEKLLDTSGGGESLIQEWWDAVKKLDGMFSGVEPRLFSNRRRGSGFCLTLDGRVDEGRTAPEHLELMRAQLGDDAKDFFARFRFHIDEQDLPDFDERLLRELQKIGVDKNGWLRLKRRYQVLDQVRKPSRKRRDPSRRHQDRV